MTNLKTRNRLINILAVFTIMVGVLLRTYIYRKGESVWRDEAALAWNIVQKSFLELFQPLVSHQAAPVGFLLLEKAIITLFGNSDYHLRLVPFLTAVAAVPLMYFISKKYMSGWGPLFATGLFSISINVILYSTEIKQYSSDVFVTLLILLGAINCLEHAKSNKPIILLGIICSISIWFSHPSLFVTAGTFIMLGIFFLRQRDKSQIAYLIGMGSIFAISLLIMYFVSLKDIASDRTLEKYWHLSFAPFPPRTWKHIQWYKLALIDGLLTDVATFSTSIITVSVFILGIFSFGFRRWPLLLALISPVILALVASAFHKYPFNGRLLLFLLPVIIMFLAEGAERVRTTLSKINIPLALLATTALIIYLFYAPISATYDVMVVHPPTRNEKIKVAMTYIKKHMLDGDLIYVFSGVTKPFRYYLSVPGYEFAEKSYIIGKQADNYHHIINRFAGKPRVWFIFSAFKITRKQTRDTLAYLQSRGTRKSKLETTSLTVYLYDLSKKP